jgi:hypothetical protein
MKRNIFLAWFGILLFMLFMGFASYDLFGELINPSSVWQLREQSIDFVPFILLFSFFGLPFMFSGGLHSNPRHFWFACIIVGLAYIILIFIYATTTLFWNISCPWPILIFVGSLGFISIHLGFRLKSLREERAAEIQYENKKERIC